MCDPVLKGSPGQMKPSWDLGIRFALFHPLLPEELWIADPSTPVAALQAFPPGHFWHLLGGLSCALRGVQLATLTLCSRCQQPLSGGHQVPRWCSVPPWSRMAPFGSCWALWASLLLVLSSSPDAVGCSSQSHWGWAGALLVPAWTLFLAAPWGSGAFLGVLSWGL